MQDGGLDRPARFEPERRAFANLLAELSQRRVPRQTELVPDATLEVKLHPVVHPPVGLRGVAARVVHREPELASPRLLHRRRRRVHERELPAKLGLIAPASEVEVIHDDERVALPAALGGGARVVHPRDGERVRLEHGVEARALPDEHRRISPRRLHEEPLAGLGCVGGELRPAAAAAAADVGHRARVEVALDPLPHAAGLGAGSRGDAKRRRGSSDGDRDAGQGTAPHAAAAAAAAREGPPARRETGRG